MLYRLAATPKLGLDLASSTLSLTSSGPTQIKGKTEDQSEIEIQYDNGVLAVRRTPPGGEQTVLFEGRIGVPSHNDLLLDQLHDLIGLTVDGKRPGEKLEKRKHSPLHHIRRMETGTVMWEQSLILSAGMAETYLKAIQTAIPGTQVLETLWARVLDQPWHLTMREMTSISASGSPLIIVPGGRAKDVDALIKTPAITPGLIDEIIPDNFRLQHNWGPAALRRDAELIGERISRLVGRPITIHERPTATMTMRIVTENATSKGYALTLAKITDTLFAKDLDIVNLETNEIVGTIAAPRWYGADVAKWSNEQKDRYLVIQEDKVNNRILGYRPKKG